MSMEAELCYCDFDGPMPSVFEERKVKARKEHTCCECCEPIRRGDTYVRTDGLWDGSWSHFDTCLVCDAIRDDYCAPYGDLVETLRESLEFDYRTAGYWWKGEEAEEDMEERGEHVDEERRKRDMYQDAQGRWW